MLLLCWFDQYLDSRAEICQSFRCFFGKSMTPKRHSEINWPLQVGQHWPWTGGRGFGHMGVAQCKVVCVETPEKHCLILHLSWTRIWPLFWFLVWFSYPLQGLHSLVQASEEVPLWFDEFLIKKWQPWRFSRHTSLTFWHFPTPFWQIHLILTEVGTSVIPGTRISWPSGWVQGKSPPLRLNVEARLAPNIK